MKLQNIFLFFIIYVAVFSVNTLNTRAAERSIIVQSTTSTQNSGFYDYILPIFKQETGITVYVVAVGTGQAIRNAQNCDGDVLLAHAKEAEQGFVDQGYGVERFDLMYNDYIIVGPEADPANIQNLSVAAEALQKIARHQSIFASRGDESGTDQREKQLWQKLGMDPEKASGQWYRETGSGMGATLNIAIAMGAYTLTDRASWISFQNKRDHKVMIEGDPALFNQYGVTLVHPAHCPMAKVVFGQKFINWLLSEKGQNLIGQYAFKGEILFTPNAKESLE